MNQKKEKDKEICREMTCMSSLHLREAQDGTESRTICGYAIRFNEPSEPFWDDDDEVSREVIDPSAISKECLDGCDIMMTMFHDNKILLARSNNGSGTLSYEVDEKGVFFAFEAPKTVDGDKAIELVKRGDIAGCSFAFRTRYYDDSHVSVETARANGKTVITYRVKIISDVRDFSLVGKPAYPQTTVEARDLARMLKSRDKKSGHADDQIREMEEQANKKLILI